MKQPLVDQYRAEFEKLKRRVEFLRILIKEVGLFDAGIDTSLVDEPRQKLLKSFRGVNIAKFHKGKNPCRCCHYSGHVNSSPLRSYDIIYLLVKNPNFQLPEPDWKAIGQDPGSSNAYRCLMLGKNGCLFGVNRPAVCLSYVCRGAEKAVLGESEESPKFPADCDYPASDNVSFGVYGEERDLVLEKLGFKKSFLLGEVADRWCDAFLAKIKKSKPGLLLERFWRGNSESECQRQVFVYGDCYKEFTETIRSITQNNYLISEEVIKFFPGFTKKEILEQLEAIHIF